MPLSYLKIELKFRWTKYCTLQYVTSAGNNGGNSKILFSVSKTQNFKVPLVTVSAKDNEKLSKLFSKGSQRSIYWNEHKTKFENKNTTNDYIYFLESNFVGVNTIFVVINFNKGNDVKHFKAQRYYLLKGIVKIHNFIINGKISYDKEIDSYIK